MKLLVTKRHDRGKLDSGERPVLGETSESLVLEALARYSFVSKYTDDRVVLDTGCGTGFGTAVLPASCRKVIGIDYSIESISSAQRLHGTEQLLFVPMDCMNIGFHRCFDLVLSLGVIEHLPDHHEFLREVTRVLKPGGVFICSTPNKKLFSPLGTKAPFHFYEFTYNDFVDTLAKYFSRLDLVGQYYLSIDRKIDIHPLNSVIVVMKRLLGIKQTRFPYLRKFLISGIFGEKSSHLTEDSFPINDQCNDNTPVFIAICHKKS